MECVGCGKEYEGHSKLCPAIGYALDRIRDCGLDSSKRRMLEEHVRESRRLLYKALAIFY